MVTVDFFVYILILYKALNLLYLKCDGYAHTIDVLRNLGMCRKFGTELRCKDKPLRRTTSSPSDRDAIS